MALGYSGTPLPKKLGISTTSQVTVLDKPKEYDSLLGELPPGATITTKLAAGTNLVHLFVTDRAALSAHLQKLRAKLDHETPIWVSWPKKSSKVPTDITEDVIRDVALPLGLVDIKVCAVSEIWSGLKLVVRREYRNKGRGRA